MKISSYKKDNKTFYKFKIRLGNKVTSRAGFTSKPEAIYAYNSLLQELQEKKAGLITFKEIFDLWEDVYKTKVKESTFFRNRRTFEKFIFPHFKDRYIQDLTPADCQNFAMSLTNLVKGKEYFNQANRIMDFAIKMEYIKTNPFDNVFLPDFKKSTKKIDFLEAEEIFKLLDYFEDNLYWYCLFRVLIYTGIRRGEILALEWRDIDFENKKLNINKTLSTGEGNKVFISTPKTSNSNRSIILDDVTLLNLKKLKVKSNSNIVFPNKKGKHNRLCNIQDKLNKALTDIGIKKIRVHDLRHTHASIAFASGASIKEIQQRLGHSDIKTTMNIYVHVTKEKEVKIVDKFIAYLENKRMG